VSKSKKNPPNFEHALSDLENIVSRMERGELSLEESLNSFEDGVRLIRFCQTALKDAEQRVSILMENTDKDELIPFTDESTKDAG